MVSSGSTVVAAREQVSSDLGSEIAILDFKAETYYGLEGVGARVWSLVQEPRTVAEVRDTLVNEYEVETGRCEQDLLSLLGKLSDKGLIEVRDGAPA